VLQYKAKAPI
jgi:hypothetical protein